MKKIFIKCLVIVSCLWCVFPVYGAAGTCFESLPIDAVLFDQLEKHATSEVVISGAMIYQDVDDEFYTKGYRAQGIFNLQGRMCRRVYDYSKSLSASFVFSKMKSFFSADGYDIAFQCSGVDCGGIDGWKLNLDKLVDGPSDKQHYFLANAGGDQVNLASVMVHLSEFDDRPRMVIKSVVHPSYDAFNKIKRGQFAQFDEGLTEIGSVYFSSNASEGYDVSTLDAIASALNNDKNNEYLIVGYADSVGSREKNRALSKLRANRVRDDLQEKYAFTTTQFLAIGGGELSYEQKKMHLARKVVIYKLED